MPRIPDDTLNRLKNDVALERLVEAAGITLKKHGQDLIGLCPFHDDKQPSLVITPTKNLWHCLGQCNTGGTVIDWVMKMEGVSFRHAVELLLSDYQPLAAQSTPIKKATIKKLSAPLENEQDDKTALMQIVDYYHQSLKETPDALAYCQQRGISMEAIETFKLGFSNRTLGYRLPEKNRAAGNQLRGQLQRLGILRSSGHEHFRGSLVIPIINNNAVLEMYGRKITDKVRSGTPLHLYLPGAHQGIFNVETLEHNNEIILCESLIDALTFWCAGFKNVTCSYGTSGFTKDHLMYFKQHNIKRILIAYDRDEAGNDAAASLSKTLIEEGIDCYRIEFPKGMDANEYALQVTPATKSLGLVIRKAVWLGQGIDSRVDIEPEQTIDVTLPAEPILKPVDTKEASIEDNEPLSSLVADELCADENQNHEALASSPLPEAAKNIEAQVSDDEVLFNFDNRRYRIRGLKKNVSYDQLKINVLVNVESDMHVDTFDLYQARGRNGFIKQASIELRLDDALIKKDLANILLKLETLQQDKISEAATPDELTPDMTLDEKNDALALLKSPDLLQKILIDYDRCGIVGEQTNKLVGYLAAVSRHLAEPLAIIIQSTSAAGKSALMDAVLSFMPEEERVQYSAMTGQSLFYMGETNLKHKILAISEEEGASNAAYALKLLQSEGQLTIASTGKDADTGKHITHDYTVEGPVMIFLTTTAIDIDEELMNRCIVLTVDEDRQQTQAIHQLQRKKRTLAGLLAKAEKQTIIKQHHNAQRLLKPLHVVNPFAEQLTFLDDKTRTRRDHDKYLTLIEAIALLHQHQRDIKTTHYQGQSLQYIEVSLDDIEVANQLANDVLGRSLDELPPQTRRLLTLIDKHVSNEITQQKIKRNAIRFSRRDLREATGWGNTQLTVHLKRLEDLEYVLVHRGSQGQQYLYELNYDGQGQQGEPFMMQLVNVDTLKHDYDAHLTGGNDPLTGLKRGVFGGQSDKQKSVKSLSENTKDLNCTESEKNTSESMKNNNASYSHLTSLAAKT